MTQISIRIEYNTFEEDDEKILEIRFLRGNVLLHNVFYNIDGLSEDEQDKLKAEAVVQKAIDNLMKDKTVFVIAHRLSTIRNADKIAVINEGELVELGNHNELMSIENGQYKALYEMQFKKQEVNN